MGRKNLAAEVVAACVHSSVLFQMFTCVWSLQMIMRHLIWRQRIKIPWEKEQTGNLNPRESLGLGRQAVTTNNESKNYDNR